MEHKIVCMSCTAPVYFKNGVFYHDVLPRNVATVARMVKCLADKCVVTVIGNSITHQTED